MTFSKSSVSMFQLSIFLSLVRSSEKMQFGKSFFLHIFTCLMARLERLRGTFRCRQLFKCHCRLTFSLVQRVCIPMLYLKKAEKFGLTSSILCCCRGIIRKLFLEKNISISKLFFRKWRQNQEGKKRVEREFGSKLTCGRKFADIKKSLYEMWCGRRSVGRGEGTFEDDPVSSRSAETEKFRTC